LPRQIEDEEDDMSVIGGEAVTVQTERAQLGRTFAMTVVAVGNWVLAVTLIYFIIALALPSAGEPGAPPLPPFVVAVALVAAAGVLSMFWAGARSRSWFWLVATLPAALILLMNLPFIAHDVTRPAVTPQFLVTVGAVTGGLAVIVGGIVAFLEVRRGQLIWTWADRAGRVSLTLAGVAVGAVATSVLAGLAPVSGGEITAVPTVTGVLTAEQTAFVETNLEMRSGETLGLFITNNDAIAHTFDIESLGIHVDLPVNSTTAVAIRPSGPGTLEFFCSVPGHRGAGMAGTIAVSS
jgi:uncharacterized cupredoxin-like copper-binding protein